MPDGDRRAPAPPEWADRLLEAALPPDARGITILGDLHEEFDDIVRDRGRSRAVRWYVRSAIALSARYAAHRTGRALLTPEGRGGGVMASMLADLRFGLRMMARTPGLSAAAILTIALGIGLTTHMYSTVDGTVIRGLPVPDGDRLVAIDQWSVERGIREGSVPWLDYVALTERESGLEGIAGYYQGTVNLSGEDRAPERFQGAFVTANALSLAGVPALLGRTFAPGEDGPDAPALMVLSHHVWQNRFAGDPAVVGRSVRANGVSTEIIGVMPEGYRFPFLEDVWLTVPFTSDVENRRSQFMDVFARMPAGSDPDAVRLAVDVVAADLERTYPEANADIRFMVRPFTERYMPAEITAVLFLMLAATFGVLLIACSNVANLLLARASLRSREVAIRTAMGASRVRVIRQLLAEALTVAFFGGALGLVFAALGVYVFNGAIAPIEKPYWIQIRLDTPALLFAMAVTLVATLTSGIYPALRASGLRAGAVLKDEGRGASSMRLGRFSQTLVVGEVAVSCGLLIAAGLMIKSVANLRDLDLGFQPESVLVGTVGLFDSDYPEREQRQALFRQLQEEFAALPGVARAALAVDLPGLGGGSWPITVEGDSYADPRDHDIVNGNIVSDGFFEAAGIPLLQGRAFRAPESWDGSDPVAVVNESFVANTLGGRDPIGMRVKIGREQSTNPWTRIVGVVPDAYVGGGVGGIGDDRLAPEQMYASMGPYDVRFLNVMARTQGPPEALADELRTIVSGLDRNLPVFRVASLRDSIDQATWAFGIFGSLFTIFGAAALILAAIGLYGVMAFSVAQRRQEMGVRMALGAGPDRILRLVLRKGVVQLVIGMALGLGLGFALSRPLSAVTFGVEAWDPTVYAAIIGTLMSAGLLAAFLPARSATRADPVEAMRS